MPPPDPSLPSSDHGQEVALRPAVPASVAECQLEEARLKLEETRINHTRLIHANVAISQDTDERKKYAKRFLYIAWTWVAVIALVLITQGWCAHGCGPMRFQLSDSVLLAAIGSTTANIFGILYVVATYLFPKK
jgi:hypothetical protein